MNSKARLADTEVEFRLNVLDKEVCCPHSCEYRSVEDCVKCSELLRIEPEAVVCRPRMNRPLSAVMEDMMRAVPGEDQCV
jgi:hypothetical protein